VEVTATAPGKLIVLGEYAVLEGADSLVWSVDRRVVVRVRTSDEPGLVVEAPDIGIDRAVADFDGSATVRWRTGLDVERLHMVGAAVAGALHELGAGGLPDVHVHIDTSALVSPEIGDKLGVGSSAAVVTALTGALLAIAGREVEDDSGRRRVFERALGAHNAAQGNVGSGIDVAASVFGGALRYRRGATLEETPTPERMALPAGLHWLAVWSGRAAYTPSMVTMVQEFAREEAGSYGDLMKELSITSARGCDAFVASDVPGFIEVVRDYGEGLARLGAASGVDIVSVDHQRIGSVVRAEGGVYKPSGAGGGDLGIALAGDGPTLDAVAAALGRAGVTTVPLAVDEHGLRLEP
jgi:phosphomevalonate kinase